MILVHLEGSALPQKNWRAVSYQNASPALDSRQSCHFRTVARRLGTNSLAHADARWTCGTGSRNGRYGVGHTLEALKGQRFSAALAFLEIWKLEALTQASAWWHI